MKAVNQQKNREIQMFVIKNNSKYTTTEDTKRKYEDILNEVIKDVELGNELEKYTINIVIGGADPLTQMYTDTDSPRTLSPTISLTNDSKESCFKGNTRHELEHVKTNWQLIRKVGTDTFLSLFKEESFPASIAFVGCAEFLSWKAAVSIIHMK